MFQSVMVIWFLLLSVSAHRKCINSLFNSLVINFTSAISMKVVHHYIQDSHNDTCSWLLTAVFYILFFYRTIKSQRFLVIFILLFTAIIGSGLTLFLYLSHTHFWNDKDRRVLNAHKLDFWHVHISSIWLTPRVCSIKASSDAAQWRGMRLENTVSFIIIYNFGMEWGGATVSVHKTKLQRN